MKTYNLKESLIQMDKDTDFKYTLTDLYEACQLDEAKKKELVQYIDAKDPVGMNAMLCNEAGVMTENIGDDIPDDEMPEDIKAEAWSPDLTDCPECGDVSFDSKKGRCTKCFYRESLKEAFQEGDMVWVKPSNKSGRVVSVKGDTVEVEIMGGEDPDRRDTFYTSDLELEDSLNESEESEESGELDFSIYNLTDDQIEKVKYIRQHLDTVEGYKAYYELEKEITDEGGCMDIFYDLSADFAWDNRFSVAITKLALADNRPDLADPEYLPGGAYAEYMNDPKYADVLLEDMSKPNLEATLRAAAENKLAEMGYEGDFIDEYFGINLTDTEDNRIKITVWGELSYEESSELADVLNHIVAEEDPDAYFDHETSGRMAAYIRKDQSEDIPDEAMVAEWSEKFNACKTWEQLKDVYGEFYHIRDDLNNGTHRALYDIIDKKIDELKPVEEGLEEAVAAPSRPSIARVLSNNMHKLEYCNTPNEFRETIMDLVSKAEVDPKEIQKLQRALYSKKSVSALWSTIATYMTGMKVSDGDNWQNESLIENAEKAPATIYSMLDAADKYVDNDEYPEGASEEEIIEIAKNNPDCMKVTKWTEGMIGPDEVVWEREVDTWFICQYEGGAEYEHAEGGYHYETLTLVDKETFPSKAAAQKRLAELAAEAEQEGQEVVALTNDFFRIKTGKYIGDCEEYHVEAKEGAHASGKKVYEGLNEAILKEMDSPEDKPYSAEEIKKEIKSLTQNFTRKKDNLKCGFKEENDAAVKELKKHYTNVTSEKRGEWFEITFSGLKKDLKEAVTNEPVKLASEYFYDTIKNIQDAGWSDVLSFAEDSGWIRGNQIVIPAGTVMTLVDDNRHFNVYWVKTNAGDEFIPFNKDFIAESPLSFEDPEAEGANAYNVTFYMDSLDDNVMSGPHTTQKIYANSEEEAKKKLMDSSTDKYYIPTIVKIELAESKKLSEGAKVNHWTDAHKELMNVCNKYFNGAEYTVDDAIVDDEVEALYREHEGDPNWDFAWLRWLESIVDPHEYPGYDEEDVGYDPEYIEDRVDYYSKKYGQELSKLKSKFYPSFSNSVNESWLTAKNYSLGIGMATLAKKLKDHIKKNKYYSPTVDVKYTEKTNSRPYLTTCSYKIVVEDPETDEIPYLVISASESPDIETCTIEEMDESSGKLWKMAKFSSFPDLIKALYVFGFNGTLHWFEDFNFKDVRDSYAGDWSSWVRNARNESFEHSINESKSINEERVTLKEGSYLSDKELAKYRYTGLWEIIQEYNIRDEEVIKKLLDDAEFMRVIDKYSDPLWSAATFIRGKVLALTDPEKYNSPEERFRRKYAGDKMYNIAVEHGFVGDFELAKRIENDPEYRPLICKYTDSLWSCASAIKRIVDRHKNESLTEAMTYTDVNGFLGEPGEKYTMSQFRRMWQDKDNDPVMRGYDSFEEWVGETISQMDAHDDEEDYIDSTYHDYSEDELRKMGAFDNLDDPVAPSGRGKLSCATFIDKSGIMGEAGAKYTVNDLADYWENNRGSDPVLANYNGDWKKWLDDTIEQMEVSYDSSLFEESLTESINENAVSSNLPENIDAFLEEIAQAHGLFDYNDIIKFNPSENDINKLNDLLAQYEDAMVNEDESEAIAKEVANIVNKKSFEDMLKDPEIQRRNAEYADRMKAKHDKENELAQEAKNWPDDKILTYEEALALAKAYYAQGGDGFYETADEGYFNLLVQEFGPQTVKSMKQEFGVFDSVAKDRMTESFKAGDRVKQKFANPYNVGEVIKVKDSSKDGRMAYVKWDYSDGADEEWVQFDEISPYNEEDEKAGYYE